MVNEVDKKLMELNKEELLALVLEMKKENRIEVAGLIVTSTEESLAEVEKCVDRLLKKHADYLLFKKELTMKLGVN